MDCRSDILFETVLRPNPPLGPRALRGILIAVVLFNLAFAALFVAKGAWPIAPFLGVDVVALAWALRASVAASRREEHLTLTPASLRILRQPEQSHVVLNPYWVRVEIPPSCGLTLSSHGKAVRIGRFLGPAERAALAQTLRNALWRARQPF